MTCHPLNIDRLQLMSLSRADATTPNAPASEAFTTEFPQAIDRCQTRSPQSDRFAPAANTWKGERAAGDVDTLIASWAKRQKFRNNEVRKRAIRLHRLLATYSAGDA